VDQRLSNEKLLDGVPWACCRAASFQVEPVCGEVVTTYSPSAVKCEWKYPASDSAVMAEPQPESMQSLVPHNYYPCDVSESQPDVEEALAKGLLQSSSSSTSHHLPVDEPVNDNNNALDETFSTEPHDDPGISKFEVEEEEKEKEEEEEFSSSSNRDLGPSPIEEVEEKVSETISARDIRDPSSSPPEANPVVAAAAGEAGNRKPMPSENLKKTFQMLLGKPKFESRGTVPLKVAVKRTWADKYKHLLEKPKVVEMPKPCSSKILCNESNPLMNSKLTPTADDVPKKKKKKKKKRKEAVINQEETVSESPSTAEVEKTPEKEKSCAVSWLKVIEDKSLVSRKPFIQGLLTNGMSVQQFMKAEVRQPKHFVSPLLGSKFYKKNNVQAGISFLPAATMASEDELPPREAARFIHQNSTLVSIDKAEMEAAAATLLASLRSSSFRSRYDQTDLHPSPTDPDTVDWIFVCSTLNFCFWYDDADASPYRVAFRGKTYSGYMGLCAALRRAVEDDIKITSPEFYAQISEDTLNSVLRTADGKPVPLLKERLDALRDAGNVLKNKFCGSAGNMVYEANGSAENLVKLVVENFTSYKDSFRFHGQKVGIYKRSQIFVSDLWACFDGQGPGNFQDIGYLTTFADYRVPQILHSLKILKYDKVLRQLLEKGAEISSGSVEEIEIRGCTIHAVEMLKEAVIELMVTSGDLGLVSSVNSALLDHHLWDLSQKPGGDLKLPFHRTRSWFY
ncbi:unnamed protein product, partial [Notodromas monacha]